MEFHREAFMQITSSGFAPNKPRAVGSRKPRDRCDHGVPASVMRIDTRASPKCHSSRRFLSPILASGPNELPAKIDQALAIFAEWEIKFVAGKRAADPFGIELTAKYLRRWKKSRHELKQSPTSNANVQCSIQSQAGASPSINYQLFLAAA